MTRATLRPQWHATPLSVKRRPAGAPTSAPSTLAQGEDADSTTVTSIPRRRASASASVRSITTPSGSRGSRLATVPARQYHRVAADGVTVVSYDRRVPQRDRPAAQMGCDTQGRQADLVPEDRPFRLPRPVV
ncbi:hypothetical protein [Streptomyces sp. NPDC048106]|uniref:hypothetical protein n=1 Tax=Streptomyces sp. NPDC048106 TaxID=3155750 RepID=UPI00345350F2